jgi:formiminotetrahydrofolate cyclodeaminase
MGEMVVNYSIGKKDLAEHQDELRQALMELHRARQILLELMVEDQQAYDTLVATRKLPATDSERAALLDAAVLSCIRVPEAIAATAAAVLELSDRLVERVNKYLLSDLAVCAELAMATVRSATYNVCANLADVSNADDRLRIESAATKRVAEASRLIQRLVPRIWARQSPAGST